MPLRRVSHDQQGISQLEIEDSEVRISPVFFRRRTSSSSLRGGESEREREMYCQSCRAEYGEEEAGTCKECYEEASETEEELHREIDHLKSLLSFLRLEQPSHPVTSASKSGLLLLHSVASDQATGLLADLPGVPAHRTVLVRLLLPS